MIVLVAIALIGGICVLTRPKYDPWSREELRRRTKRLRAMEERS